MRVLALDYGSARTGVAVSDPTGLLARPLGVVARAASPAGLDEIVRIVGEQEAELVVVGLPLTLRGERGTQALETEAFADKLRSRIAVPIEFWDERLTTRLAAQTGSDAPIDAVAASLLLQSRLDRGFA